jgi:hypothetical protein
VLQTQRRADVPHVLRNASRALCIDVFAKCVIGRTSMLIAALLFTALLFGGMMLYSFGFAAFLFNALPAEIAGPTIRRAFPFFYLFVIGTAVLAAAFLYEIDPFAGGLMLVIAVSTLPTRQLLMPAINRATDTGAKAQFKLLHGLSVVITLLHIGIAGFVLSRFV